jgi:hypothetical protein
LERAQDGDKQVHWLDLMQCPVGFAASARRSDRIKYKCILAHVSTSSGIYHIAFQKENRPPSEQGPRRDS